MSAGGSSDGAVFALLVGLGMIVTFRFLALLLVSITAMLRPTLLLSSFGLLLVTRLGSILISWLLILIGLVLVLRAAMKRVRGGVILLTMLVFVIYLFVSRFLMVVFSISVLILDQFLVFGSFRFISGTIVVVVMGFVRLAIVLGY